ncbi:MAG: hypothetical protein ACTSWZ_02795 [Candidatus Heimdallarchaeaceae archaeon]
MNSILKPYKPKQKLIDTQTYTVTGKTKNFIELDNYTLINTKDLEKETGELKIGDKVTESIYEVEGSYALKVVWKKVKNNEVSKNAV